MLSCLFSSFSPILAANGFVYAFRQSDAMGQGICVILFLASIVVWVVMWDKSCSLNKARRESTAFLQTILKSSNPLGLKEEARKTKAPSAQIYLAACNRIESFHIRQPGGGRRAMSDDEIKVMRSAMEQAVEDQILILQEKTMILATAVSGSPFLGLFGTVWVIVGLVSVICPFVLVKTVEAIWKIISIVLAVYMILYAGVSVYSSAKLRASFPEESKKLIFEALIFVAIAILLIIIPIEQFGRAFVRIVGLGGLIIGIVMVAVEIVVNKRTGTDEAPEADITEKMDQQAQTETATSSDSDN